MILNVPGKVTVPKDKVELNLQAASATVPTLFAPAGMGLCRLLALREVPSI